MTTTIDLAELRRDAAALVRRASQGERILITSRNRAMAELRPLLTVEPDDALLEEVARRLSEAAPGAEIVLFGPRDGQQGDRGSQLDLVVIESDFDRRGEEAARLRKALRGLDTAIELVLYRRREADERRDVPGTFLYHALKEGRLLIEG
ncbi:MAG: type II toxin-antitoxin system prevent-host-death family antitoxin [Actinobacteria bacterium]|nr:type II toxin-antitoxin system prevent-host-death family antitoxin [Actinomycetota bacterium]